VFDEHLSIIGASVFNRGNGEMTKINNFLAENAEGCIIICLLHIELIQVA